jgi:hypothetical protein
MRRMIGRMIMVLLSLAAIACIAAWIASYCRVVCWSNDGSHLDEDIVESWSGGGPGVGFDHDPPLVITGVSDGRFWFFCHTWTGSRREIVIGRLSSPVFFCTGIMPNRSFVPGVPLYVPPVSPSSGPATPVRETLLWVSLWIPTIVSLALLAAIGLPRPAKRWWRRRHGRCLKCGYSLAHLPEPRCPECGTPFSPWMNSPVAGKQR